MTKKEREILIAAINDLERNPCCWEDAMSKLYPLAGWVYSDHRKTEGKPIGVIELAAMEAPNAKANSVAEGDPVEAEGRNES